MNRPTPEFEELKNLLDGKVEEYNRAAFIDSDPICIPHLFSKKEDVEISAFLTSVISWGNRKSIIANARQLIRMTGDDPHHFVMHATTNDLKPFRKFVHRTFNSDDCILFLKTLKKVYAQYTSLEDLFHPEDEKEMASRISAFRHAFFGLAIEAGHARKHLPDPLNGSAAKRINMFLRWMVRNDAYGVDFGLWKKITPAELICPLDVHSGRVARQLGLLTRKTDDWKAAIELTERLRQFDPADPVRYDFALFGIGVSP